MSASDLLDPELLAFTDVLPNASLYRAETLAEARAAIDALTAGADPASDGHATIDTTERKVPSQDGYEIPVIIHAPRAPSDEPRSVVLHCHGGGFITGSARMANTSGRAIAAMMDCLVISVDYRLAPEARYPTQVEDCYAVLRWLHAAAEELGIDTQRIAVMGESAGGGLAAALALLARDRGEFRIAHQHLLYPMLDDRTCLAQPDPFTGKHVWTPEANMFGWTALLGEAPGGENVSPYAAPARAENLSGLPGAFLMIGALDLFIEENLDYARRLIHAGVPTELHVYPGGFHGFDLIPGVKLSERARHESMAALQRALQKK